ncbi:MAG TPA: PQQ-dependent sugar dehydrogenase [Thermoanaerobaculia bacterium]|nr:PQQ-dependent sugar dehydrogenase [Thermoanaerobaculia bacterium]
MPGIHRTVLHAALAAAMSAACLQQGATSEVANSASTTESPRSSESPCEPLQTSRPNASGQQPVFPAQTRACAERLNVAFEVITLARGLVDPWAVEPLPDGDLLVTEKPGRMRIVTAAGEVGRPLSGIPEVDSRGQGGLLDVALSPGFESDRTIYWSYSEPRQGGNATSVARGILSVDSGSVRQVRVIFRALPAYDGTAHYGSRLAFGPDGMLYVTLGERSSMSIRPQAQHFDSHMGKIVRIRPAGTVPPDNPFVDKAGALPEIWTLGHRNIQSAAFDPDGRLWIVEHGPRGGDELNLIRKGKNYGWPLQSFGEEYSGRSIATAETTRPGIEDPVYYWDPVIAPSGMEFYTGGAFPQWHGSVFVGGLVAQALVRLTLENDRVTGEEHLLGDRGQRIRDVRQGPDGALYVVTDERDGELWKIVPGK